MTGTLQLLWNVNTARGVFFKNDFFPKIKLIFFRTFLPPSLKIHKKSCTEEKPMVKPPREESYASKQKAMVNYPKLKSQQRNNNNKVGEEKKEEKFQLERPTTYTVEPSVDDLKLVISSAKELESPRARTELMSVIQKFLDGKREK